MIIKEAKVALPGMSYSDLSFYEGFTCYDNKVKGFVQRAGLRSARLYGVADYVDHEIIAEDMCKIKDVIE